MDVTHTCIQYNPMAFLGPWPLGPLEHLLSQKVSRAVRGVVYRMRGTAKQKLKKIIVEQKATPRDNPLEKYDFLDRKITAMI